MGQFVIISFLYYRVFPLYLLYWHISILLYFLFYIEDDYFFKNIIISSLPGNLKLIHLFWMWVLIISPL
jgi:hypothetical protein